MTSDAADQIPIRPVLRADLPGLLEFIGPFVEQKKLLPRTTEELETMLAHGFVAEDNGRIVGFSALEVYSSKLAELRSLAVAAEYQGRGLGARLVKACVQRATELNVLEVLAVTSAEDFFRRCGFNFTLPGEKKALFFQTRDL